MHFVIGVYSAPDSSGAQAAYQFAQALLKKNHRITLIFFYESGVEHADKPSPFESINTALAVCSTSRPKSNQSKIKPLGLVQYINAILNSDRHVIFR